MKELYKYKDRVLLYDTETKEVKELDKKTARKVLDSRAKVLDSRVRNSIVKDILEIYDDTLIIVTDEKNKVVYKGIVDYAPKEVRDGRWHKGANNKTFTINSERGVLTVKVLDSSFRDSITEDSHYLESNKQYMTKLWNKKDYFERKYKVTITRQGQGHYVEGPRKNLVSLLKELRGEDFNANPFIHDSITEDALSKFVQSYLSTKKVSSKTEQDEIIKFLLERNKITTEDIPKVRALLKIIKDSLTEDSVEVRDKLVEPEKKYLTYFENEIKKLNFRVVSVSRTLIRNGYHYQVISNQGNKTESDFRNFVNKLEAITNYLDRDNVTFTYNASLQVDGYISAGVDFHYQWIKDAMSESQALENFKRFLKKHYEYTDEDLKKARVEFEKIDYPFKKSKEVWYGLPDGRVASYCSLDGKKWEDL